MKILGKPVDSGLNESDDKTVWFAYNYRLHSYKIK